MFLEDAGIDLHDVSQLIQSESAHFRGAHWTDKLFIKASERFPSVTFNRKRNSSKNILLKPA
jgi:hypothetical protein